jgi:hypothetical protein
MTGRFYLKEVRIAAAMQRIIIMCVHKMGDRSDDRNFREILFVSFIKNFAHYSSGTVCTIHE